MARRREFWRKPRPSRRKKKLEEESLYLLDQFSTADIEHWGKRRDKFLEYHWQYYSSLAYQRSKVLDKIKAALLDAAEPLEFRQWQRAIRYKFVFEPLSAKGSLNDPGGRFNIGDIGSIKFSPFPALYLAEGQDTAMQEMLCQQLDEGGSLTPFEFALANKESFAVVSVNGFLDNVINLHHPERLEEFVGLIRDFQIPDHILELAKDYKFPPPGVIRSVEQLVDNLQVPNWRLWPMQFDVPSTTQIFGQLISQTGIQGIAYVSKFNGKGCIAVFPKNFIGSASYIELADVLPEGVKHRRLDAATCADLC